MEEKKIDEAHEILIKVAEAAKKLGSDMSAWTELTEQLRELNAEYAVAQQLAELEDALADASLQALFTDWESHLEMDSSRLQPTTQFVETHYDHVTNTAALIEKVPEPVNAYAKQHKPGAIYRSGANEWYVESGSEKVGSGYLVTRQWVESRSEFRWFCTCIAAKRVMYKEIPYCKHMYAVQQHIQTSEYVAAWTSYARMIDVARFWVRYEKLAGLSPQEQFYLEELFEALPDLEGHMAYIEDLEY
jgi:hypothetical protein